MPEEIKESPMPQKFGLKETLEMYDYFNQLFDKLIAAKENDGKISIAEAAIAAAVTLPAGMKAYIGKDQIDDEMKELDNDELIKIAAESRKIHKKILSLFMKRKEMEEILSEDSK